MLFLSKLDPNRYAAMLAQLTNDATLGRAFPQTLHAAWSIASGWKKASVVVLRPIFTLPVPGTVTLLFLNFCYCYLLPFPILLGRLQLIPLGF